MKKIKKWKSLLFVLTLALFGSLAMVNVRADNHYDFGSATEKADRLEAEAHNTDSATVYAKNLYDSASSVQLRNGAKLTFKVNAEESGDYILKYAYFTDSTTARMTVSVNNGTAQNMGEMRPNGLSSIGGGSSNNRQVFFGNYEIQLQAGENTIVIANSSGNTDVDFIELYEKGALYYYPIECQQLGMQKVGERIEAEWGYATDASKYTNSMKGNGVSGCCVGLGGQNATAATMNYKVLTEKAGTYYLQICNTGGSKTECKQTWIINGESEVLQFKSDTGKESANDMQIEHRFEVELKEGENLISFTRNSYGVSTDWFKIIEKHESNVDTMIQAEDFSLGAVKLNRRAGTEVAKEIYLGYQWEIVNEYLDGFYTELHATRPATVEIPVTVTEEGWYDLYMRAYTSYNNAKLLVSLDGEEFEAWPISYTNGFGTGITNAHNVFRVYLTQGEHTFVMKKDSSAYVGIDWLYITKAAIQSVFTTLELDFGETYDVGNAIINVGEDGLVSFENGKIGTLKPGTTSIYHQIQMNDKSNYLYSRPYTVVINKSDFAETDLLIADNQVVTYNGTEWKDEFASAPDGWTVEYHYGNGNYTDAGIYNVAVQFLHEAYNTIRKDVTLTILPTNYTGDELKAADAEYVYNGERQVLVATAPEGWTIEYVNNGRENAGTQVVTIYFDNPNYSTVTKEARLTINKAKYSGTDISLEDAAFEYDGKNHILTASALEGWTITYQNNEQNEIGDYKVTAVFEHVNYETVTKTATLTIKDADVSGSGGVAGGAVNSSTPTGDSNFVGVYMLLLFVGVAGIVIGVCCKKKHTT